MAYISLYRKYRPQSFEEVVGQDIWVDILRNSIRFNKISHAYIFSGPRGIGKTSIARIFAKALNCEEGPTPTPCNRCANCVAITRGTSLDVVEIDAASNRGIDEIRALKDNVNLNPVQARFKVYIIDEVHMLTQEAFSALLKTLEEPPSNVVFIMATTDLFKIPLTIRSRAMIFTFSKVYPLKMLPRLKYVAEKEGIKIKDEDLLRIARDSDGAVRDALVMLEKLSILSGGNVKSGDVDMVVSRLSLRSIGSLLDNLAKSNWEFGVRFIREFLEKGGSPLSFIRGLRFAFWYLLLSSNVDNVSELLSVTEDEQELLSEFTGVWDEDSLWSAIEILDRNCERVYRGDDSDVVLGILWGSLLKLPRRNDVDVQVDVEKKKLKMPVLSVIMEGLLERNVALYAYVGVADEVELVDDVLKIVFDNQHAFVYESLTEPENKLELESVISEILDREVGLEISINGEEQQDGDERFGESIVKKIVSTFGGEVIAVRLLEKDMGEENE